MQNQVHILFTADLNREQVKQGLEYAARRMSDTIMPTMDVPLHEDADVSLFDSAGDQVGTMYVRTHL